MDRRRAAFLEVAAVARALFDDPALGEKWDGPSALPEMTVRALAGHLARAMTSVVGYLDAGVPDDDPISPAAYYARAVEDPANLSSEVNRGVRARGEEIASVGRETLTAELDRVISGLEARLTSEPRDRVLAVFKGLVLRLDDYLATRIIELVVHVDDLALSLGRNTPDMPRDALDIAIDTLVSIGRYRHGDLAVVRALSRRERDAVGALRVL